jgi:hypothetical protein
MKIEEIISETIISELSGIKKHTGQIGAADPWAPYETDADQYPDVANQSVQYRDILIDQGFREIGSGGSGSVWIHPNRPHEALKVFVSTDGGYTNWVNICQTNRGNPNLPKFFSAKPRKITKDFMAVRTELLSPADGFSGGNLARQIGVLVKNCAWGNKIQGPTEPSSSIQDMRDYIETAAPDANGYQRFNHIKDYLYKDPGFLKALWILTIAVREKKGRPDLQGANLMMRGSTYVIADPLS